MIYLKKFILIILLMFIISSVLAIVSPRQISDSDSITAGISGNELVLFDLINSMRVKNNLPPIPISSDLCKVARYHIDDLIVSKPQVKGCGLHSWSNSGNWTPCCDFKNLSGVQCMKLKPKEITGYPGFGYELIYWGNEAATPCEAAALWQQVEASANMILGRGKWKGFQWKALGIGIKEGYAVLWLGDKPDKGQKAKLMVTPKESSKANKTPELKPSRTVPVDTITIQNNNSQPEKIKETIVNDQVTDVRYYLVVASLKTSASAKSELKRFKSKGYPNAVILEGASIYRIGLMWFKTEGEAKIKSNELKSTFPGIWVFKQ